MIVWDLLYSLSELIFEFPSRKAITRVQASQNVNISRNSDGHISVVRDATVRWLGMLVVLHILCTLMWPWPDPMSRSRSLTSWSSKNLCAGRGYNLVIVIAGRWQQAVHAGGDDRQPPCGAFWLFLCLQREVLLSYTVSCWLTQWVWYHINGALITRWSNCLIQIYVQKLPLNCVQACI